MSVDRRQFIGTATLVGAGLIVGCGSNQPSTDSKTPPTAGAAPPATTPATLHLLLWGSALYAFSQNGSQVEVSYLITDPHVPDTTFVPHQPMIMVGAGTGKINTSKSTLTLGPNGSLPKGVYRIAAASLRANAGSLTADGLADPPMQCAGDPASLKSLAFVPTLVTKGGKIDANWPNTFETRVVIANGELRAHAPLNGQGDVAEWEISGPNAGTTPWPFTDTLELVLPLAGNSLTLVNETENNKTIVIETDADPTRIEVRLMAHPPDSAAPVLTTGNPEPHLSVLYAVFTPKPHQNERAELLFRKWCSQPAPAPPQAPGAGTTKPVAALPAISDGPSPGKYCTGAKVMVG